MKTEVLVALVSSVTGTLGAIIACVQAWKTARLKEKTDALLEIMKQEGIMNVEKVKAESERRRKAFEISLQESKPIEIGIVQAWQDVQTIKDELSKLIAPSRYDLDLALLTLKPACKNLIDGYARLGADVPSVAREAWHKAKGIANTIEFIVASSLHNEGIKSKVSAETSKQFQELRLSLTDVQMTLVNARQTIRDEMAHKIFEIL